ncbi:MAG: hypothetical protein LBR23_05480 [Spirochaetaceae bacterium]|jgi:hypothetical protein|nr:hypothetical protein [Spirochaetaceae bacterium]
MIAIQQTVTIPADRRIHLDVELPDTVSVGSAQIRLNVFPEPKERGGFFSQPVSLQNFKMYSRDELYE